MFRTNRGLDRSLAGVVVAPQGKPFSVMGFTIVDSKIAAIDVLADPERLNQLDFNVPE